MIGRFPDISVDDSIKWLLANKKLTNPEINRVSIFNDDACWHHGELVYKAVDDCSRVSTTYQKDFWMVTPRGDWEVLPKHELAALPGNYLG